MAAEDRCSAQLEQLARLEPDSLRTFTLRARYLTSQKRGSESEELLAQAAAELLRKADEPAAKRRIMHGIGDAYAAARQFIPAERWYRELTAEDPYQFYLVASVLAKQGKMDAAIDFCQSAAEKTRYRPTGDGRRQHSRENRESPESPRAEPILDAALQRFSSDVRLTYSVAVLRIVQGRFDDAIALLRKLRNWIPSM